MNPKLFFVLLWFGITTLGSAQDESVGSCRFFERDDRTIFVLTTRGNDRDAHFYQFSSDPENRYRDSWSKVVVDTGALVTAKGESDGIEVTVRPWPATDPISIQVKNWPLKISVDGDYQPIEAPQAQRLAQAHFDEADKVLNETYQSVVERLPKAAVETLRSFERDWIAGRDRQAAAAIRFNWGSLSEEDEKILALFQRALLTWDRVKLLGNTGPAMVAPGHNGLYQDVADGVVWILEEGNEVRFAIKTFNTRNGSAGSISGKARIDGNRAVWKEDAKDKLDPSEPAAEVTLTFKPFGLVEVQTQNAQEFSGDGAEFDGKYLRSGLTPPKSSDLDEDQSQ